MDRNTTTRIEQSLKDINRAFEMVDTEAVTFEEADQLLSITFEMIETIKRILGEE